MTNFLYEMQDVLCNLNMLLSIGDFSTIKKLVDHIENQGKQLRELNKAITKKNETITGLHSTITGLRSTIASLNADKINLLEKIDELNNGIRDSEDLSWKEKYDLAIKEKECAVNALQHKCKYLENQIVAKDIAIESVERARDCLREKIKKLERANLDQGDTIGWYVEDFKKLKEENEKLEEICRAAEKSLENYVIRCDNLEHNYDEEVKMKEQFKTVWFRHESTIATLESRNENQRKEISNLNKVLEKERKRNKELEELYSSAQSNACMLNLKVMELNQGIRDSTDLTWKKKYDELEANQEATIEGLKGKLVSISQLVNEITDVLTSKE